jgi:DNA polymerase-3 subunit alpha
MEKEVMGIYVSDHPLRGHERVVRESSSHSCGAIEELEDGTSVRVAGVIAGLRTAIAKSSGKRMAMLVLEDFSGQCRAICFPQTYEKLGARLVKDLVVQLTGTVMHQERPGAGGGKSVEIRVEDVRPLEAILDLQAIDPEALGSVEIRVQRATESQIRRLQEVIARHPGSYELVIRILPDRPVYTMQMVNPTPDFKHDVQELLIGAEVE